MESRQDIAVVGQPGSELKSLKEKISVKEEELDEEEREAELLYSVEISLKEEIDEDQKSDYLCCKEEPAVDETSVSPSPIIQATELDFSTEDTGSSRRKPAVEQESEPQVFFDAEEPVLEHNFALNSAAVLDDVEQLKSELQDTSLTQVFVKEETDDSEDLETRYGTW
jgi:hypothetical protein